MSELPLFERELQSSAVLAEDVTKGLIANGAFVTGHSEAGSVAAAGLNWRFAREEATDIRR
jgi:hypothetical protein